MPRYLPCNLQIKTLKNCIDTQLYIVNSTAMLRQCMVITLASMLHLAHLPT
jgi:hypothetical protein